MTGKIEDVASGMLRLSRSALTVAISFSGITGCHVLPASQPVRTEIWYVASPIMPGVQRLHAGVVVHGRMQKPLKAQGPQPKPRSAVAVRREAARNGVVGNEVVPAKQLPPEIMLP